MLGEIQPHHRCSVQDLNPEPLLLGSGALPTELPGALITRKLALIVIVILFDVADVADVTVVVAVAVVDGGGWFVGRSTQTET